MLRVFTALLLAIALPFLVTGSPVCCLAVSHCCDVPARTAAPSCCARCESEPEEPPPPPPTCECDDHPVDVTHVQTDHAPAPAPVLATTLVWDAPEHTFAGALPPEIAAAPPRAAGTLTLPLLL